MILSKFQDLTFRPFQKLYFLFIFNSLSDINTRKYFSTSIVFQTDTSKDILINKTNNNIVIIIFKHNHF